MKFPQRLTILLVLLPFFAVALYSKETDIYIGISSKYNPQNLPKIAMGGFDFKNENMPEEKQIALTIASVVRADLMRSRYFDIIDNAEPVDYGNLGKTLSEYQKTGINYVLFGEVNTVG
ncbi:MAG: hypothetical protein LBG46_05260, partial [Elusimicrobiota bacterium]|nr:hypothetical protein [Elusimicrobiota bacterium]